MNRIDKKFRELRKKRKKAFVAFITAGDPSLAVTGKIVLELERRGADIIELGIPFSDPLADGPTIQKSSERALKKGVNIDGVCNLVKKLRKETQIPLVYMTYYNLIYHYGPERLIRKAKSSGVDGIIVPDLPPEESGELQAAARKNSFSLIHLAAPTSSAERIKKIAKASTGFIYYVSLTGITGARKELSREISGNLRKIKSVTKKPVCIGFGISKPDQVKKVSKLADGVIVGSAIVSRIEKNAGKKDLIKKVGKFAEEMICML